MNRTRMCAALLASLFMLAVGVGVAMGWDERSGSAVEAVDAPRSTSSTVAPTTTTHAPTTTTPSTTTTVPRTTTTRRPVTTVAPTTEPPTTEPPITEPPTTAPPSTPPPTTPPTYDPVLCATINRDYAADPNRVAYLMAWGCPPRFW